MPGWKPSLDAQPKYYGNVAGCEASVSLLDITEILQRFMLNFKLIVCIDVRTFFIILFLILSKRAQLTPS